MKISRILINMLAITALTAVGTAYADETTKEGYLVDKNGNVVRDRFNGCVRTNSWTPEMAIAECDPDLVKKEEPKPVEPPPPPAPAPAPAPAPEPEPAPPPAPVSVTMQAETLFAFNNAELTPNGKKILDNEVVEKVKQFQQVDSVQVIGHADIIGSEANNEKVSQMRAEAVKAYLVSQGIAENLVTTASKGSSEPLVSCDTVQGAVAPGNQALVECLQPNRRVVVEVRGLQQP